MSCNSRKLELHQSSKINRIQSQNFDYFFVLDFEAVWNPDEKVPEEIIEFPTVVIDAKTLQVVSEFHEYVRPILNKTLNSYCIEMTKITQEMVDAADPFPQVFSRYDKWIKNFLKSAYGFEDERTIPNYYQRIAYVTCGNWDLNKMVKIQCKRDRIEVPEYFDSFINIKEAFYQHYHTKRQKHQLGMASILRDLKIPLQGHHHSGIDDCRNIARIVIRMVEDSFIFNFTFPYNTHNNNNNNQNNLNNQRNDLHPVKYPMSNINDNQNRIGETIVIQSNNNNSNTVNKKKNRVQNAYIPINNDNNNNNANINNNNIYNNNKCIGEKRANHSIPIKQGRTNDGMISVRSCGILVLKKSVSKPNYPSEFLLMKHKNRYDLPKGHQHEGETDIDTAYRELWEETGITQSQITLIPNFNFTSVYYPQYARFQGQAVRKTVVYFAGYLCDSDRCDISLEEHIGFEWMAWNPYGFISKNINPILSSLHQFLTK